MTEQIHNAEPPQRDPPPFPSPPDPIDQPPPDIKPVPPPDIRPPAEPPDRPKHDGRTRQAIGHRVGRSLFPSGTDRFTVFFF